MNDKPHWKGARYQEQGGSRAATKVFNTKVELTYLNPQYELEILPESTITDQALLLVGRLTPRQESLPHFSLRWDEKCDHLNVDMIPQEESWQSETKGYKGHRPQKTDKHPGRAFLLIIKTPTLDVIDAVISFNLAREVSATVSIGVSATASYSQ